MSVTVVGRGQVMLTPDIAVVDLGCEGVAPSPAEAVAIASAALDRIARLLVESGVAEAELRSTELSLWAETDPQGQPRGYRSMRGLAAAVRDVTRVGDLVSAAVAAGGEASRVRGLTMRSSQADAARAQARDLAWADAVATAEQLAALAGRSLGRVAEVTDGEPTLGGGPGPIARAFAVAKDAGAPVYAGQLEVAAAVTVTWDLA